MINAAENRMPGGRRSRRKTKKKERQPVVPAAGIPPSDGSEAELRTEHELQVVVGATIKIDLVANVNAKPDRAGVEFNAAARIEHAVGVALENVHGVAERGGRRSAWVGHAELQEPALHRREQAHRTTAGLDLRTKQAMQHAQAGAAQVGRAVEAARY